MIDPRNIFDALLTALFTGLIYTTVTQYNHIQDLEDYRDTNHACQLDIDVEVGHQMALNEQWKKFQNEHR